MSTLLESLSIIGIVVVIVGLTLFLRVAYGVLEEIQAQVHDNSLILKSILAELKR